MRIRFPLGRHPPHRRLLQLGGIELSQHHSGTRRHGNDQVLGRFRFSRTFSLVPKLHLGMSPVSPRNSISRQLGAFEKILWPPFPAVEPTAEVAVAVPATVGKEHGSTTHRRWDSDGYLNQARARLSFFEMLWRYFVVITWTALQSASGGFRMSSLQLFRYSRPGSCRAAIAKPVRIDPSPWQTREREKRERPPRKHPGISAARAAKPPPSRPKS